MTQRIETFELKCASLRLRGTELSAEEAAQLLSEWKEVDGQGGSKVEYSDFLQTRCPWLEGFLAEDFGVDDPRFAHVLASPEEVRAMADLLDRVRASVRRGLDAFEEQGGTALALDVARLAASAATSLRGPFPGEADRYRAMALDYCARARTRLERDLGEGTGSASELILRVRTERAILNVLRALGEPFDAAALEELAISAVLVAANEYARHPPSSMAQALNAVLPGYRTTQEVLASARTSGLDALRDLGQVGLAATLSAKLDEFIESLEMGRRPEFRFDVSRSAPSGSKQRVHE